MKRLLLSVAILSLPACAAGYPDSTDRVATALQANRAADNAGARPVPHAALPIDAARPRAHERESRDLTVMKTLHAGQKTAMAIQSAELAAETRKREAPQRRANDAAAALARVVPTGPERRAIVVVVQPP